MTIRLPYALCDIGSLHTAVNFTHLVILQLTISMHHLFKGKREDHRLEFGVIGAGVVLGAAAGLGAPPGLSNHLSPQAPPRRTSSFIRHRERVADSKAGARHFTEKVLALLKGGGEAIVRDNIRFKDVEVTSGISQNREDQV